MIIEQKRPYSALTICTQKVLDYPPTYSVVQKREHATEFILLDQETMPVLASSLLAVYGTDVKTIIKDFLIRNFSQEAELLKPELAPGMADALFELIFEVKKD